MFQVQFLHVCFFLLAQCAKKCDTNQIPSQDLLLLAAAVMNRSALKTVGGAGQRESKKE